jgi:hypothetical protein
LRDGRDQLEATVTSDTTGSRTRKTVPPSPADS